MRSKIKFLFTVLLLGIGTMLFSNDSVELKVMASGENSFLLRASNLNDNSIEVLLKDLDGFVLYSETIESNNFECKYNLKNLPSGKYILNVDYGQVLKIQSITKKENSLIIENENLKTLFKPAFRHSLGYLDLEMPCGNSTSYLSLRLTDENGNVLYKEKVAKTDLLKRKFNLLQLENGSYTFELELNDGDQNFAFEERIAISK